MSRRIVALLAVIVAVACAAAAFVWLHAGGQSKAVVQFTPDPPAADSGASREAAPTAHSNAPAAKNLAKPPVNVEPPAGFVPVSGEVLEFTSSVAKVNNVASLRLVG